MLAAFQVMVLHSLFHMKIEPAGGLLGEILMLFPGVPIFFFVSGYLISRSYENNSRLREYAQNRIIRIYPGLIVCTFLAISSVVFTGYFSSVNFSGTELLGWIGAQISFLQFYNPDFMRGYGTGVLNGSLATISIELQFYILIPIVYWILGQCKSFPSNALLIISIFVFFVINQIYNDLVWNYKDNLLMKLWGVSFFPWLYMFLIGMIFQRNFDLIHPLLQNRVVPIAISYTIIAYISVNYFGWNDGNFLNPLLFLMLAGLVFSFAYSFPELSNAILKRNDISYGVYIYHIPVINLFIFYGYISDMSHVVVAWILTVLMAIMSWIFIEKPCLKLKRNPLNPLNN